MSDSSFLDLRKFMLNQIQHNFSDWSVSSSKVCVLSVWEYPVYFYFRNINEFSYLLSRNTIPANGFIYGWGWNSKLLCYLAYSIAFVLIVINFCIYCFGLCCLYCFNFWKHSLYMNSTDASWTLPKINCWDIALSD